MLLLMPLFLIGFTLWPNRSYDAIFSKEPGMRQPLLENAVDLGAGQEEEAEKHPLKPKPLMPLIHQILSPDFWIITGFMSVCALNLVFYIGSVYIQFTDELYISAFTWIYTFGVIFIPIVGLLLDKYGSLISMFVVGMMFVISSGLAISHNQPLQIATFVVISVANNFLWAVYFSFLASAFGFHNYGKLMGASTIIIALVGLLQYPLFDIAVGPLNSDFSFIFVGFLIGSIGVLTMTTILLIKQFSRSSKSFFRLWM